MIDVSFRVVNLVYASIYLVYIYTVDRRKKTLGQSRYWIGIILWLAMADYNKV